MINAKTLEVLTHTHTHVVLEAILKTYSLDFGTIKNIKNIKKYNKNKLKAWSRKIIMF